MKRIPILLCFLFCTLFGSSQEHPKNYHEAFALIEVWLEAQKDFENIPGITAMILQDQEIVWTGAFGKSHIEQDKDMDTHTICSICSITKSFTAVAIMRLVDEGKLHLEDKVKDLLPFYEVHQKFPKNGAVTVGALLSHASGLPGNTGHSYFSGPDFTFPSPKEFRSALKDLETKSEVGTDVAYSNIGYALLGEIIAKISGIPYEEYIQKEILNPLKMTETTMGAAIPNKEHAMGYTAINRNGKREMVNEFDTKAMQPAMGLWTSIHDLAKYAKWQFRLYDASRSEILKPSTLKKMHQVHATSKNGYLKWGLGFEVIEESDGNTWISHGGTCPGFVSLLQLNISTKLGLAILINGNRSQTFKYLNGIKQILDHVKPLKNMAEHKLNLKEYTGYYNMNPWNSEVYISSWAENLVVLQLPENSPGRRMMFYEHVGGDTFRYIKENGELGDTFTFERDQKGKVYRYVEGGNYKNKIRDK
ncbi:serine hydrolase [Spongiimicrobium salis]|uniref:serine hydrolase n=1 Tax=Spongiimicrobium salis TaxID=1667022 RepID=UPI00374DDFDA